MTTIGLAGDTMLGRKVAERLAEVDPSQLFDPAVVAVFDEADIVALNLECCISDRGSPWPDPRKPFFFRAPPRAVEALALLGVDIVTLGNNHALDFGEEALLDTFEHLERAGISWVGAGEDLDRARAALVVEHNDLRLAVVGMADHPQGFAAAADRPGIAFADLARGVPQWVGDEIRKVDADAVLVTPHWGPNMTAEPVPHVVEAAETVATTGVDLIAGHSAHVFHGVRTLSGPDGTPVPVLYDLGDFIDDYAVDATLRNDLGLLWLVTLDGSGPVRLETVPLALDYCFTRLADPDETKWITDRFVAACAAMGTDVQAADGRLVVSWASSATRT